MPADLEHTPSRPGQAPRSGRRLLAATGAGGAAVLSAAATLAIIGVLALAHTAAAQDGPAAEGAPPRLVILARSDVPADALASGPVGGVLGAPVLLTPRDLLHPEAAAALESINPDIVVLAGGAAALSAEVEAAVNQLGYPTRRAAGADRHETAALVSALLAEFSTGRPVLTGTPVTDAVIPGLNAERLQGQTPDDLVADLTAQIGALQTQVDELTTLLAGVTRETVDDRDTLRFAGMNLQVVNGTGDTDGDPNGVGNVIIGYNAEPPAGGERSGSHYLVVGDEHDWTAHGGIVAGFRNVASGSWATVTGGLFNTASGFAASVTGGGSNSAEVVGTSVTGGSGNIAGPGNFATVSGGSSNTASGSSSSVSGGEDNTADGPRTAVVGGANNLADGPHASVSGGRDNIADGDWASVSGGVFNTASGSWSSVSGGQFNEASGSRAAVTGGRTNTAAANWSIVVGGGGRTIADTQANECDSQVGSQSFADSCPF